MVVANEVERKPAAKATAASLVSVLDAAITIDNSACRKIGGLHNLQELCFLERGRFNDSNTRVDNFCKVMRGDICRHTDRKSRGVRAGDGGTRVRGAASGEPHESIDQQSNRRIRFFPA